MLGSLFKMSHKLFLYFPIHRRAAQGNIHKLCHIGITIVIYRNTTANAIKTVTLFFLKSEMKCFDLKKNIHRIYIYIYTYMYMCVYIHIYIFLYIYIFIAVVHSSSVLL